MRKISIIFVALALNSNAQNDVILRINHKLDLETFALDAVAQNNLGNTFKATRLEYYISQFTIIHDGGVETIVLRYYRIGATR